MPNSLVNYDPVKLNALMQERGITAADLARATSLRAPSIWALVHGVTKMPKASTLVAVANALGVPLAAILKGPGRGPVGRPTG
jgi:transcriptional regulator with XRE-family HTH domain